MPVHFDAEDGRVHEFCCKSHADEAIAQGAHPPSERRRQWGRQIEAAHRCTLPGCTARRFIDPDTNAEYDYCGRSHAREGARRGIEPPPPALGEPAHFDRTYSGRPCTRGCASCSADGTVCRVCEEPYTVSTMTNAHPKYDLVRRQFLASWAANAGPAPTILRVLQVRNPETVFQRYQDYKTALAAAGRGVNEERRFHATGMTCSFGIDLSQRPCDDAACAVCSIAASAFKLGRAGGGALTPAFGSLRYGRGLYFARMSSKSHDYGGGSERVHAGSRQRVMFLVREAASRPPVGRSSAPLPWLRSTPVHVPGPSSHRQHLRCSDAGAPCSRPHGLSRACRLPVAWLATWLAVQSGPRRSEEHPRGDVGRGKHRRSHRVAGSGWRLRLYRWTDRGRRRRSQPRGECAVRGGGGHPLVPDRVPPATLREVAALHASERACVVLAPWCCAFRVFSP